MTYSITREREIEKQLSLLMDFLMSVAKGDDERNSFHYLVELGGTKIELKYEHEPSRDLRTVRLLSKKDACLKLSVSGSTLEKLMCNEIFPKPIKFPGAERIAFADHELDNYIDILKINHRGRAKFRGRRK